MTNSSAPSVSWATSICSNMEAVAVKAGGSDVDYSLLTDPTELALSRKLSELQDLIAGCARDRAPFRLPHYAQDLASLFHQFYTECRVIGEDNLVRPCLDLRKEGVKSRAATRHARDDAAVLEGLVRVASRDHGDAQALSQRKGEALGALAVSCEVLPVEVD